MVIQMKIIAHINTEFKEKFGIPRQSGLVEETVGKIVFEKEYRVKEALRGLEEFSHIWVLWEFSKSIRNDWSPTVRPPLLGGNKRIGVFATRSPFRPNPIGLSCVKIEKIEYTRDEGPVIFVKGADLLDGTPIYDIKPYLPYTDSHPEASGGFTDNLTDRRLDVKIDDERFYSLTREKQKEIVQILSHDPRPSYKNEDFTYGFNYGDYEIKFQVQNGELILTSIENI